MKISRSEIVSNLLLKSTVIVKKNTGFKLETIPTMRLSHLLFLLALLTKSSTASYNILSDGKLHDITMAIY